jgi:pSer/pThr/pTyr-binding forkhead associated (FHA) protein
MAGEARPELIFLSGPQRGERAVLMGNVILLGRGAACDVCLTEEHVSREQARLSFAPQGWVFQNLSANGTRVNGKKFKKPKQVFLDTGDVLAMGVETQVLYVAPGDDPEEALAAYRQAHPEAAHGEAAPPSPPAEEPSPPAGGKAQAAEKAPAGKAEVAARPPAEQEGEAEGEEEEEESGSNRLKLILFGIVLLGVCAFGVVLIKASGREDDSGDEDQPPPRLTEAQIREAIREPLVRSPSPVKAADALDQAVRSYTNRNTWERGDLYRCVRNFKLHRAYRHSRSFERIQHERMFEQALRDLEDQVCEKYDTAWKFERAKSYRNARTVFEEFLEVLPMNQLERSGPIRGVIMENVIDHLNFIKHKLARKKMD